MKNCCIRCIFASFLLLLSSSSSLLVAAFGTVTMASLPPKFFKALVSGVVKMNLLEDPAITPAFIAEQIFAPNNIPEEEAAAVTETINSIVVAAARANASVSELEKVVKKNGSFSTDQTDAFLSAWKSEGPKVHARNVAASDHTPGLQKSAWRVDVTTQSRHASELNEASAIIQLTTSAPGASSGTGEAFQFEMNRSELSSLLATVNDINDAIQKRAGAKQTE